MTLFRLLLWVFKAVAARVVQMLDAGIYSEYHCQQIEDTMKYTVHVPLGKPLQFPDLCPFTDTASPDSSIRLKKTSTSMVVPLIVSSNTTTSICFPAQRKVAVRSMIFGAMIWVSLLGGIGLCIAWLSGDHPSRMNWVAMLFLAAGLSASAGFGVARYWILRRVRISSAWEGFIEVKFKSESFAKAFAELNRLAISAD